MTFRVQYKSIVWYNSLVKMILATVAVLSAFVTANAVEATLHSCPPPDTEFETNLVAEAWGDFDRIMGIRLEFNASPSNNVQIAFGSDENHDGVLSVEESEFDWDGDGLANDIDPDPYTNNGDCHGQGEGWVLASFTNSAEIAAAGGYTNWVASVVENDTDGWWYSFTIKANAFDATGHAVVRIDDKAVVLDRENDSATFLLMRGRGYPFSVDPSGATFSSSSHDGVHPQVEYDSQIGIRFSVVSRGAILDKKAFSVSSDNSPAAWMIEDYCSNDDGIRVFVADNVVGSNAFTDRLFGAVFVGYGFAVQTLAHEIGHYLGADDVYVSSHEIDDKLSLVAVTGNFDANDMSDIDWNNGSGQRFYKNGERHSDAIERLLMYGFYSDASLDIPHSEISGVGFSADGTSLELRKVKVGRMAMSENGGVL